VEQTFGYYRAFISYSQQDKVWGRRIHTWLESYRLPADAMLHRSRDRRLGRFFRDDEDMAAAANIAEIVRSALDCAEALIVICSPRSAQSKWVNAEIQHYRRTGRSNKVFAVIIDGEPNSGDPETECFPPALRAAGDPDDPHSLPIEPMGLDVRKEGQARVCARLAAGLLGADFDALWQRDRRRTEQRQRLLVGGLTGISMAFAALAATAIWFGIQSEKNAAEARVRGQEAEAARDDLQREYLGMLGETALDDILDLDNIPGEVTATDPVSWISLMQVDGQQFALAREYSAGRVIAVAHDGVLTGANVGTYGKSDRNKGFLWRAIQWLAGPQGNGSVKIASGHCEWLPTRRAKWALPDDLAEWGYSVGEISGVIDDASLQGASVLIIGNAWGNLSKPEIDAIQRFVARGGGLLAAGLGWSWKQSSSRPSLICEGQSAGQDINDMAAYPMNRMGEAFGMQWTDAVIGE